MKEACISVIIPVYNAENVIERCINSILNQTYSNFEIILINDGSTDRSEEVILPYLCNKIHMYTIANSGPGIARKVGYEKSAGELLFFVDSDDYLPHRNVLEQINSVYANHTFDILFFNFSVRDERGKEEIANSFFKEISDDSMDLSYFDTHVLMKGALWCKIFRRELMKPEFFYDARNFEDFYTTYRYLDVSHVVRTTSTVCYCTDRSNPSSLTKSRTEKKSLQSIQIIENLMKETKYTIPLRKLMMRYCFEVTKDLKRGIYLNTEIVETMERVKKQHLGLLQKKCDFSLKDWARYFVFRFRVYLYGKKIITRSDKT